MSDEAPVVSLRTRREKGKLVGRAEIFWYGIGEEGKLEYFLELSDGAEDYGDRWLCAQLLQIADDL